MKNPSMAFIFFNDNDHIYIFKNEKHSGILKWLRWIVITLYALQIIFSFKMFLLEIQCILWINTV